MANYRAARIAARAEGRVVLDATCGAGGDSVALARAGLVTISMDRDAERALFASQNLRLLGLPDRVLVGDALEAPLRAELLVLDPARRERGARTLDPERWSPPLGAALALAAGAEGASIKLAPAIEPELLERRLARDLRVPWSLEWVDLDRELCEVTLWTGVLASPRSKARETVGIRSAVSLETGSAVPGVHRLTDVPEGRVSLDPSRVPEIRWFFEPNPAVIRAGLVGNLARELGMPTLGPGLAWLVGEDGPGRASGLGKGWPVLDAAPADRRQVRAMLARHDIGPLSVKKRGHPDSPEVLARRFRGPGGRPGLIAVGRLARGHVVLLLETGGEQPREAAPGPRAPGS